MLSSRDMCDYLFSKRIIRAGLWLNDRINDGIWNLDLCEDEEYEKGFKKVGEEE